MGISKELFISLRDGLMDGIKVEEMRRLREVKKPLVKVSKPKVKKDDDPTEHR